MTENKTPKLPHVLANDGTGGTLSVIVVHPDGAEHGVNVRAFDSLSDRGVTLAPVDPEALLRSLAQHTPHLRIVDAVEHAPEALDVIHEALCDAGQAWSAADRMREVIGARLAAAGLAVGPAGSGVPTTGWTDAEGKPVYAGRASEDKPDDMPAWEWQVLHDAEKEAREKAEAEVANLRDALEKAEERFDAHVKHWDAEAEAEAALERRTAADADYAAARQALTEGATSQGGE